MTAEVTCVSEVREGIHRMRASGYRRLGTVARSLGGKHRDYSTRLKGKRGMRLIRIRRINRPLASDTVYSRSLLRLEADH